MRILLAGLFLFAIGLSLVFTEVQAGDKKKAKSAEVTLTGKILCGKCALGVDAQCATAIAVTGKDKKDTIYYFDKAGHAKYHDEICTAAKKGSVTGVISKDGARNIITVKAVKFD